jgi:hypothetical protein
MNEPLRPQAIALVLMAATVGGCVGYFAFFWIVTQGFYGIMLPPALVGLAAGYCMPRRSQPLAIACALGGLALGLYTEWRFAPFIVDNSLLYFITHVHKLRPITQWMLVIGTVAGYFTSLGTERKSDEA